MTRIQCNFCGDRILKRQDELINHAEQCRPDKIRRDMHWGHVKRIFYNLVSQNDSFEESQ